MFRNGIFLQSRLFEIVVLILISALVYLPNVGQMTYYKDDWYYVHDAFIAGPRVFQAMFAIDRPARGPFFEIYYSLFGYEALPYHLGMFLWRIVAVIGVLWLINILWPRDRRNAFGAALLFAVYPGFLWWMRAIEDQPMIASLALEVVSIVFTLKAVRSNRLVARLVFEIAAIFTGWAYIALVDYAIGMEVFRLLCIFILLQHRQLLNVSFWKLVRQTARVWLIYLTIPIGFLVWREFFFTNSRRATDVGFQLGRFFSNPLSTSVLWIVHFIESVLNVGLFAWVTPFVTNFFNLRLRDIVAALLIMCIVILIVITKEYLSKQYAHTSIEPDKALAYEVIWLGLLGTAFGVLPVILANRYIEFQYYSHYALPVSLAGVVLLIGLVNCIAYARVREAIMIMLVALASLTHYAVSIQALLEEQAIRQFWWQMAWRAPDIKPGTTIVINYPSSSYGDPQFQSGEVADLLYYPGSNPLIPVKYTLPAALANDDIAKMVLRGANRDASYRSHAIMLDFRNTLVLTQPSDNSCVHVIDSGRPLISSSDPGYIQLIAPYSKIDNVVDQAAPVIPRKAIYGPEPTHKWCFYYEKMDLAIQENNWGQAVSIGNKALELGLHPEDQSEWIPLVMAYAVQGDANGIKATATKINGVPFLRFETCQLFSNIKNQPSYSPEIQTLLSQTFCHGK